MKAPARQASAEPASSSSSPRKPLIISAFGARGSGKSAWVKQTIGKLAPTRLAVWDLMQEYPGLQATDRLGDAIRAMQAPRFRLAFYPSRDDTERARQFELWCSALLLAGHALAVVEEMAFVTRPSWAPRAWREMVLLGRHPKHSLSIIGTSQRPAHVDKDFVGNADLVHCGRLAYRTDARVVSEVLGVRFGDLLSLPDLEYFERRAGAGTPSRGRLVFTGKERRPVPVRAASLERPPKEADNTARPTSQRVAPFSLADLAPARQTPQPSDPLDS